MRSAFVPGDELRARGRLWRLRGRTEHADCVALDLVAGAASPGSRARVLLEPFDLVTAAAPCAPELVSPRAWWRRLAARALSLRTHGCLVSAAFASLDLFPYQLEPALAVTAGGVTRLLLADAVGLGKTVQAGIVLSELFARGETTRGLVLVPAGLRDQWAGELRDRFGLDADVVDAAALRTLAASLPRTVSPWLVPRIAVVSIDLAKRADVRLGLLEARWDAVVIDEAHTVTADSDRYRTAHPLAARAKCVVLITATPHDGRNEGFAALTRIGATPHDAPIVMFRRSRRDVGLAARRRTRLFRVRLGSAEREALDGLLAYARRLWTSARPAAARPVGVLLLKRALSSPSSLHRSILRRRELLAADAGPEPEQLLLPLDDDFDAADEVPLHVLGAPGLDDAREERAWLDRMAAAAERAAKDERKLHALARLLRRTAEPAIVFTEYRDTQRAIEQHLSPLRRCVTLHGGLTRSERDGVLRRFDDGRADVLLATDAAGAGLNLHRRCRLVITLELPWSPVRLEQRVGRVDRIGQSRTVHAVHLVGRGTPEERVLAQLVAKAERARAALGDDGAPWIGAGDDEQIAGALIGGAVAWAALQNPGDAARAFEDAAHAPAGAVQGFSPAAAEPTPGPAPGSPDSAAKLVTRLDLTSRAVDEAASLLQRRRLHSVLRGRGPRSTRKCAGSGREARGPTVTFVPARLRGAVSSLRSAPGIVAVFEAVFLDGHGRAIDEAIVTLLADLRLDRPLSFADARRSAASLCAALPAALSPALDAVVSRRLAVLRERIRAEDGAGRERLATSEGAGEDDGVAAVQPGLFDRRADREAQRRRGHPGQAHDADRQPPANAGAGTHLALAGQPRLTHVLVVTTRGRGARAWTT